MNKVVLNARLRSYRSEIILICSRVIVCVRQKPEWALLISEDEVFWMRFARTKKTKKDMSGIFRNDTMTIKIRVPVDYS